MAVNFINGCKFYNHILRKGINFEHMQMHINKLASPNFKQIQFLETHKRVNPTKSTLISYRGYVGIVSFDHRSQKLIRSSRICTHSLIFGKSKLPNTSRLLLNL